MTSKLQAQNHTAPAGRRIQVRRSGVHGKGVFAVRDIEAGEVLIEYTGERITWAEALDRHPHDPFAGCRHRIREVAVGGGLAGCGHDRCFHVML